MQRTPPPGAPPPSDEEGVDLAERFEPAVDEAQQLVDFTADRVRSFRDLLGSINSPFLIGLILLYVAAAATGLAVVLANPIRDGYMFAAMYGIVFAFLLLYVQLHYRRKPVRKVLAAVLDIALMGYWALILYDRIPARNVWHRGSIIERPRLDALWVPIGMLAVVAVALALHVTFIGRYWGRRYLDGR